MFARNKKLLVIEYMDHYHHKTNIARRSRMGMWLHTTTKHDYCCGFVHCGKWMLCCASATVLRFGLRVQQKGVCFF